MPILGKEDIKVIFDPQGTIDMIVRKALAFNSILNTTGLMQISHTLVLCIDHKEMIFKVNTKQFSVCRLLFGTGEVLYPLGFPDLVDKIVEELSHLRPSELVRVLDRWDSIGPWLDSLAVDPDPAADLEAEDYLRARLVEARLR